MKLTILVPKWLLNLSLHILPWHRTNGSKENRKTSRPPKANSRQSKKRVTLKSPAVKRRTTPKIVVSPSKRNYNLRKAGEKRQRPVTKENEVCLHSLPKRRRIDEFDVVQVGDLKMKIRRSTRILCNSNTSNRCPTGSAYVDFPVFEQSNPSSEPTSR